MFQQMGSMHQSLTVEILVSNVLCRLPLSLWTPAVLEGAVRCTPSFLSATSRTAAADYVLGCVCLCVFVCYKTSQKLFMDQTLLTHYPGND